MAANPNRIWRVGETTWRDTDLPYQVGTDAYYRAVAERTAKAKGETYQKSPELLALERSMAADQLATPEARQQQEWIDAHKETERKYAEAQTAYLQGQTQWEADIADLARQRDQRGRLNAGYEWVPQDGVPTGIGPGSPGEAGTYRAIDRFFSGVGKMGGAGNRNAARGVDNSWNEVEDGVDVRTDEQRFHDRNLKDITQVADAEGRYDWYANEDYYDERGQRQTQNVNLSNLARRTSAPNMVGPGQGPVSGFDANEIWDYNNVNGYGINEADYWNQVRNRANKSVYGRTV
jgi:hypothetical protein